MQIDEIVTAARPYQLPHHLGAFARTLAALRRFVSAPPAIEPLPPPPPTTVEAQPPPVPEVRARVRLGGPGWTWPVLRAGDGRRPVISDGYHTAADFAAGLAKRTHRGVDVFYERPRPWLTPAEFAKEEPSIYRTRGYEIVPGTLSVACGPGRVAVARQLATGWCVSIDHGFGIESVVHHLFGAAVHAGEHVVAGQPIGLAGGSPPSKALPQGGKVHVHFELWRDGRHFDPAPYMRAWPVLAVASAPTVEVLVAD